MQAVPTTDDVRRPKRPQRPARIGSQDGHGSGNGGKGSDDPQKTKPAPLSLAELVRLKRPVTIEELIGALPFLKYSTIANALARGEIPGTKVTARRWIISPAWLKTLARSHKIEGDTEDVS